MLPIFDPGALRKARAVNPRIDEELVRARNFLLDMQSRLIEKAENGRERDWRDVGLLYLLARLQEEAGEVAAVLSGVPPFASLEHLVGQCADVANISMMIADRARYLRGRIPSAVTGPPPDDAWRTA